MPKTWVGNKHEEVGTWKNVGGDKCGRRKAEEEG